MGFRRASRPRCRPKRRLGGGIRGFTFAGSNYIANITRIAREWGRNGGKLTSILDTLPQKYVRVYRDNYLLPYFTLGLG